MMNQRQDDARQDGERVKKTGDTRRQRAARRRMVVVLRYGWPALLALGFLWFPFDWLSTVWPPFGVPFRMVFHSAHDHFIGHTVFFLLIGVVILGYLPGLRRQPLWYLLGLVLAALVQETIQALFRGQAPTFTDYNAFTGDALGGVSAFALWSACALLLVAWKRRTGAKTPITPVITPGRKRE